MLQAKHWLLIINILLAGVSLSLSFVSFIQLNKACGIHVFNTLDQPQVLDLWTPFLVTETTSLTVSIMSPNKQDQIYLKANMLNYIQPTAVEWYSPLALYHYNYTLAPGYYSLQGDNVPVKVTGHFQPIIMSNNSTNLWNIPRQYFAKHQLVTNTQPTIYNGKFPVLGNVTFEAPYALTAVAAKDLLDLPSCHKLSTIMIVTVFVGVFFIFVDGVLYTYLR